MYLRIDENDEIIYPYSILLFRQDFPNTSPPRSFDEMSVENREYFGIYPVVAVEEPEGEVVEELLPTLVEGQWTQTFSVRDFTQEELDAQLFEKRSQMVVTMRQARRALRLAGLLDTVDSSIDLLPEPDRTDVRIEWEYAQEVERLRPFVLDLQPLLGLTDEQLDQLFELASTL